MFNDFRARGKGWGERNMDVREKHRWASSHMHPDRGWNLQLGVWPDQELNTQPFRLWDNAPPNWATAARAFPAFDLKRETCNSSFTWTFRSHFRVMNWSNLNIVVSQGVERAQERDRDGGRARWCSSQNTHNIYQSRLPSHGHSARHPWWL